MLALKNKYRFIMCSVMITISNFSDAHEQRLHLLISWCYSRCMDMRVLQRGSSFGAGFPIGASSIPIGSGISKGNSVSFVWGVQRGLRSPLTGRIQRNRRFRGTRFSAGKSSVLYLCFRLPPKRGWLRHLQPGQIDSGQILLGGSRSGGFCTITNEIVICTEGKIWLAGKVSKGISTPVPQQRQCPR